jgi:hypothetical protein
MRLKARALLSPKLFQAICHGTSGVVPLGTAKVSFRYATPRCAIFLVPPKVGHLTAFDGTPTKFVRKIHGPPRNPVFAEIRDRLKGSDLGDDYLIVFEVGTDDDIKQP